jgi:arsenate reductase-like glutaredoxin family protein
MPELVTDDELHKMLQEKENELENLFQTNASYSKKVNKMGEINDLKKALGISLND